MIIIGYNMVTEGIYCEQGTTGALVQLGVQRFHFNPSKAGMGGDHPEAPFYLNP